MSGKNALCTLPALEIGPKNVRPGTYFGKNPIPYIKYMSKASKPDVVFLNCRYFLFEDPAGGGVVHYLLPPRLMRASV